MEVKVIRFFFLKQLQNTNHCGISRLKISNKLSEIGLSLHDIDAILITHEHEDHVQGLKSVLESMTSVWMTMGLFLCLVD